MEDEDGENDVIARRIVMPTALWLVLKSMAEVQGKSPQALASEAIRVGLGAVSVERQAPARLIERLDEFPDDGDDDAWLEGL